MLFKKKQPPAPLPAQTVAVPSTASVEWELPVVALQVALLAPILETKDVEPLLIHARLADHYRDLNMEPVPPQQFDRIVEGLDGEGWRRLALAVGALDSPPIRTALASLKTPVSQQIQAGFVGLAKETDALTLSLIRQSDVRAEEFARHLATHLGIAWRGETTDQSQKRLTQIDYKRLLGEAEEAKKLAEDRMEYLRKKQEERGARRRPRGKQ